MPSLADALRAAPPPHRGRVILALPDGTRPVDLASALPALREHVDGVGIIGLGLHRPMAPAELPPSPFPLVQHDPDDVVSLGEVQGLPGRVARRVAEADTVLGVGIVELHQYAGFSGGHKAVAVGCGGRATIDALHHRDRVTAPGVELGRLDGNPFRAAVDALGERAGLRWVLLQAGGSWFAGEPVETLRRAAASLDCWWDLPRRHPAAVLRVPPRKAANFYQASRAATYLGLSAAPPLDPGATLYLEAACPEGLGLGAGELAFAEVLRRSPAPWTELLDGPAPSGGGTQRAIMLALLLRRFRLVVCGLADPAPLRALGLEASRRPAAELAPPDALVVPDPFHRLPRLVQARPGP